MIKNVLCFLAISLLVISCGHRDRENSAGREGMLDRLEQLEAPLSDAEKGFMNNLSSLCGKSFRGQEIYSAPGRESWADRDFVMHVTVCETDRVHIPFHLNEDRSRTLSAKPTGSISLFT